MFRVYSDPHCKYYLITHLNMIPSSLSLLNLILNEKRPRAETISGIWKLFPLTLQACSNFKLGKCKQILIVKAGKIQCCKEKNITALQNECRNIPFQIYLMNDVLHHCVRKSNEELKLSFESVAVEMFCSAWISSSHGNVATGVFTLRFHLAFSLVECGSITVGAQLLCLDFEWSVVVRSSNGLNHL